MKRLQQAAADLTRRGRSRWVCIEWTLENIVRSYILYLYCYLYLYHNHHHCIEWPLEDIVRSYITENPPSREAFISHWLPHSFNGWFSSKFLTKVIYHLSYCDKLHHWEPSLTRGIYQSLTATFFPPISWSWSFLSPGWIGAGTRCCPLGEAKVFVYFLCLGVCLMISEPVFLGDFKVHSFHFFDLIWNSSFGQGNLWGPVKKTLDMSVILAFIKLWKKCS